MAAKRWGVALALSAALTICAASAHAQDINELMRNDTPPRSSNDGSNGWEALGDILAGGAKRRAQEAGARELQERIELANSIDRAEYLNHLVEIRDLLTEIWKAMGIDPAIAGAVAVSYAPDETDQVVLLTARQSGYRKAVQDAVHALVERNYKLANQLALASFIMFEEQRRAEETSASTPTPASSRYWEGQR